MKKNILLNIKSISLIVFASFIAACSVNLFYTHYKLLSGGVSGIALIIQYIAKIPAGYLVFIINIPLFFWSMKEIDKQFTLFTIIGTVSQSIFLVLTKDISKYFFLKDILLSCIYGGAISGIAMGIVFSNHGSLGGADIISVILRRKYDFDIGNVSFAINAVIVSIGALFFGIPTALYTLIAMYISSMMVDRVIKGFNRKKLMFIISNLQEEITEKIKLDLNRSSTILYGQGTFTGIRIKVIYCVVSTNQVPKLKQIVREVDPEAFMSIIDTAEVEGRGFKKCI